MARQYNPAESLSRQRKMAAPDVTQHTFNGTIPYHHLDDLLPLIDETTKSGASEGVFSLDGKYAQLLRLGTPGEVESYLKKKASEALAGWMLYIDARKAEVVVVKEEDVGTTLRSGDGGGAFASLGSLFPELKKEKD